MQLDGIIGAMVGGGLGALLGAQIGRLWGGRFPSPPESQKVRALITLLVPMLVCGQIGSRIASSDTVGDWINPPTPWSERSGGTRGSSSAPRR